MCIYYIYTYIYIYTYVYMYIYKVHLRNIHKYAHFFGRFDTFRQDYEIIFQSMFVDGTSRTVKIMRQLMPHRMK